MLQIKIMASLDILPYQSGNFSSQFRGVGLKV